VFNKDVKVPLQKAELVGTSSSNKNSVTEAITKRIHFLTGMLNKRDTEDLFNQEKH
jgi:hypothetical protein